MHNSMRFSGIAAAVLALGAFELRAVAQEDTTAWTCQDIGAIQPEPLGDREGHSVVVAEFSCRLESGPLAGGVATGTAIWEGDGPKLAMLAGSGVIRKPGSTVVWNAAEAKLELAMADGKVTGWTVSGRGIYPLATGGWASMAGKPFTWTGKTIGPAQYSFETKSE